jgi:hypothetical protein
MNTQYTTTLLYNHGLIKKTKPLLVQGFAPGLNKGFCYHISVGRGFKNNMIN